MSITAAWTHQNSFTGRILRSVDSDGRIFRVVSSANRLDFFIRGFKRSFVVEENLSFLLCESVER